MTNRTDTERLKWLWNNSDLAIEILKDQEIMYDITGDWIFPLFQQEIDDAMDAEENNQ